MLSYEQQNDALRFLGPLFTRIESEQDERTRIQVQFKLEDSPCEYTQMSAMGAMGAFNVERLDIRHFQVWRACYEWYGNCKGLAGIAEESDFSEEEFTQLLADMRVTFRKLDNTYYPTDVLLKCLEGR